MEKIKQIEFNAEEAMVEYEITKDELDEVRIILHALKIELFKREVSVNALGPKRKFDKSSPLPVSFRLYMLPPIPRSFPESTRSYFIKGEAISTFHWLRCC